MKSKRIETNPIKHRNDKLVIKHLSNGENEKMALKHFLRGRKPFYHGNHGKNRQIRANHNAQF